MHMDSQENRRAQLRKWVERNGTPPKEKSYFSQLVSGSSSFGEKAARRLEKTYGMGDGWLDGATEAGAPIPIHSSAPTDKPKKSHIQDIIEGSPPASATSITGKPRGFGELAPASVGRREIPVISYVQAGMMTEAMDPFSLGDGFETVVIDEDYSEHTFALRIKGNSMLPMFEPGDTIIIDPSWEPRPGEFVVAKNTEEEATFKKYRPRGTSERGEMVFELVPLNDDYPTLNSERDHLHIIGVMAEHRRPARKR